MRYCRRDLAPGACSMKRLLLLSAILLLASCASSPKQSPGTDGPRILGVFAHPDDETGCAATIYSVTHRLNGLCDLVCITDGQGGYKYSTLAEPLYGLRLTDEAIGRRELPAIRRREMLEAAEILGVNKVHFLNQPDHRYTQDEMEILDPSANIWDTTFLKRRLRNIMVDGDYDFVLIMMPTVTTHGHHKAASILALDVVNGLPLKQRPVILGTQVLSADEQPESYTGLAQHPLTNPASADAIFTFNRLKGFGHKDRLHLRIIVDWVIAAHKSQGTMQLAAGQGDLETFTLFAISPAGAMSECRAFFKVLDN